MKVEFTLLTGSLVPACRAFNERIRAHGEPPFLLPEDASANEGAATHGGVCRNHYVAVDERGAVRGGVLLMEQRGWLGSTVIPLINIQSPLSEGIVDRSFSGVSLQMLKFVYGRSPFAYAVGMAVDAWREMSLDRTVFVPPSRQRRVEVGAGIGDSIHPVDVDLHGQLVVVRMTTAAVLSQRSAADGDEQSR